MPYLGRFQVEAVVGMDLLIMIIRAAEKYYEYLVVYTLILIHTTIL